MYVASYRFFAVLCCVVFGGRKRAWKAANLMMEEEKGRKIRRRREGKADASPYSSAWIKRPISVTNAAEIFDCSLRAWIFQIEREGETFLFGLIWFFFFPFFFLLVTSTTLALVSLFSLYFPSRRDCSGAIFGSSAAPIIERFQDPCGNTSKMEKCT